MEEQTPALAKENLLITLLVACFCLLGAWQLGFLATNWSLQESGNETLLQFQDHLKKNVCSSSLSYVFCRTPTVTKKPLKEISFITITPVDHQYSSYHALFSSQQTLPAALDKLQWQGGDEVDAIRLLTIVLALSKVWEYETYSHKGRIQQLLMPVWQQYPDMVAASTCSYCGGSSEIVLELMATKTNDLVLAHRIASGDARYFAVLYKNGIFNEEQAYTMARTHAWLSFAGDTDTGRVISNILINNNDYESLYQVAINGQMGVSDSPELISRIPEKIIQAAWWRQTSDGTDLIELTEYLVSHGYRPALRWLVWITDGATPYLTDYYAYNYRKPKYLNILKKYTEIPTKGNTTIGQFYSDNWKKINWNPDTKKWEVKK
jgi:hypothetical protein